MDYTQVLQPLFNTLWYLISLAILAAVIKPLVQRQSLMGLGVAQVHSLVVFVGNSTFKTLVPESVAYGGGYIRFIKAQTEERLSDSEAKTVIETIESGWLAATFRNHRKHISHVKKIVVKKGGEPRCPKCQRKMVKRTLKRRANAGKEFLGCKAFPRCRGIVSAS